MSEAALLDAIQRNDVEAVRVAVQMKGANPNKLLPEYEEGRRANLYRQTPFLSAVAANRPEIVKLLVSLGANVNQTDSLGQTGVHLCAVSGNKRILDILMRAGADCRTIDVNASSPYHKAMEGGNMKVMSTLHAAHHA